MHLKASVFANEGYYNIIPCVKDGHAEEVLLQLLRSSFLSVALSVLVNKQYTQPFVLPSACAGQKEVQEDNGKI